MSKVSLEVAQEDVEKWLDYKKLGQDKKEQKKDAIEKMVRLVADGTLVIDTETFEITQELKFEVGEETLKLNKLVYKPRVKMDVLRVNLKGVDVLEDMTGYGFAFAAALTGQPKGIIGLLDSEDYNVVQAIVVFFT